MLKEENFSVEKNYPEKYLQQGRQTIISPEMQKAAEQIKGNLDEKVQKIFKYIPLKVSTAEKEALFRKRTAQQIIESGFITGCTDSGLVFVAFARACGIPAKYIETIDEKWLKEGGDESGHIYSEIYDSLNKKWRWIDPEFKLIDSPPIEKKRIILREGLDSWDIGIKDEQSLKDAFKKFREIWLEQQNLLTKSEN